MWDVGVLQYLCGTPAAVSDERRARRARSRDEDCTTRCFTINRSSLFSAPCEALAAGTMQDGRR